MSNINIIFPNQLFEKSLLIENLNNTYLIEEYLFFKQYKFHKQKILFHRDSMKNYNDYLVKKGLKVIYIDSQNNSSDIREFLKNTQAKQINIYNPVDNWLEKRISSICCEKNIEIKFYENPLFINNQNELTTFFKPEKKKLFQTSFYKNQRTKLNILLDKEKKPVGGKWTFDDMNRKKFPKNKQTPILDYSKIKSFHYLNSKKYVEINFRNNLGEISENQLYPTDYKSANIWFKNFLISRFEEFKDWKLGYIIENTLMNLEELDVFKCIFEEYENTYHDEIWLKLRYIRKEYKNSLDTISGSLAAQYINKSDNYEMKGMKLKRNRNEI